MTLLCIDDDPEDIELFREAVRMIDDSFTCVEASNGLEGLDILRKTIPDYIFLDMNMPIMDGKETLRVIRGDERLDSVPVYMLSTSSDFKEAESCRRLGAKKWLVKPGSFQELISRLRSVLDEK
jgi:CheY-like chemotaxis protein